MTKDAQHGSAMTTTIPFSRLIATDAINARAATKDGLDELAASIAAKGLIQPLCVRPADSSDKFEVIDGRRRYQAIAKLVKAKTWAKATPIPVLIRNEDDAAALEASLMANTVRLPMHPVDQFAVFARLSAQGVTDDDIAARFGITARTVRQHRALGALAPAVRDAWRKGKLDADAAKAFTLHPDHAVQVAAYERLKKGHGGSQISDYAVRRELSGDRPAKARVEPELLARYVAAGGKVTEDLFSDDAYLEDGALLKKLKADARAEKLAATRAKIEGQGWGWIALATDLPRGWYHWPELLDYNDFEATGDAAKRIEELHEQAREARADGNHKEAYRLQDLASDADREAWLASFTPEMRARCGVVLVINGYTGDIDLHHGVVRPSDDGTIDIEDAIDSAGVDAEHRSAITRASEAPSKMETCPDCGGVDSGDCDTCMGEGEVAASVSAVLGAGDAGQASTPVISSALLNRMTAAQTEAVDRVIADDSLLAIRVFVASRRSNYGGPVNVRLEGMRSLNEQGQRYKAPDFGEALSKTWALMQGELLEAFADLIASAIDLRAFNVAANRESETALVSALPGDRYLSEMRRLFDAADYFKSVPKELSLSAIEEMREAGAASGLAPEDVLADMKKGDLAKAAATAAQACGWLPPELRNAAYALATPDTGAQRLTGKVAAAEQTSEAA